MNRIVFGAAAGLVMVVVACAPRYRASFNESESPILSADCEVRMYEQSPDRPFVIVGEIAPEDPNKLATDPAKFLAAVRPRICKHGGNALIAIRDEQGRYTNGTVIRLR